MRAFLLLLSVSATVSADAGVAPSVAKAPVAAGEGWDGLGSLMWVSR